MDAIGLKRIIVLLAILILFHFYYTYFQVSLRFWQRLEPFRKALNRRKE